MLLAHLLLSFLCLFKFIECFEMNSITEVLNVVTTVYHPSMLCLLRCSCEGLWLWNLVGVSFRGIISQVLYTHP